MLKVVMLVLFAEIWNTAGQVLFKKGTNSIEARSLRGMRSHLVFLKEIMAKPEVWLGFGAMAAGLVVWFIALAGADLTVVSPMGSMQYVIILVAAHFFLGEKINAMKLSGTLLVVLGIILLSLS